MIVTIRKFTGIKKNTGVKEMKVGDTVRIVIEGELKPSNLQKYALWLSNGKCLHLNGDEDFVEVIKTHKKLEAGQKWKDDCGDLYEIFKIHDGIVHFWDYDINDIDKENITFFIDNYAYELVE